MLDAPREELARARLPLYPPLPKPPPEREAPLEPILRLPMRSPPDAPPRLEADGDRPAPPAAPAPRLDAVPAAGRWPALGWRV
jgi:hypothetical protein